jgi:hypothetical protein
VVRLTKRCYSGQSGLAQGSGHLLAIGRVEAHELVERVGFANGHGGNHPQKRRDMLPGFVDAPEERQPPDCRSRYSQRSTAARLRSGRRRLPRPTGRQCATTSRCLRRPSFSGRRDGSGGRIEGLRSRWRTGEPRRSALRMELPAPIPTARTESRQPPIAQYSRGEKAASSVRRLIGLSRDRVLTSKIFCELSGHGPTVSSHLRYVQCSFAPTRSPGEEATR